jgi:predicted RNase H-like nuclease (RuvC/YqgF family)
MDQVEQLVSDLQKENQQLREELEEAQKDIVDFEVLAKEWRKGYAELELKHRIKVMELEQVIDELEKELEDWKTCGDYRD